MKKNKSLKIFYEAQLSCPEGRWGMTMTITRADSTWTSPWFAFNGMRFQTFEEAREKAAEQFIALRTVLEGESKNRIDQWGVYGPKKRMTIKPDEGAWKCGNGHWFAYAPPPAWPPWCAIEGCESAMLLWIVKDDVTSKDWPPFLPYASVSYNDQPVILRPMTDGPPWLWPDGKPPRKGEEDGKLLPEVRPEPEEP